ncbi:MAG: DUF167 domain-containing protein [Candidatus Eremiobacteraeota bacterium]|nr:DUF167 domain-containing protein [Candidatus Eremiobacteraeota bacterium]
MKRLITVRVKPSSRAPSVREEEGLLIIAVREPPRENRANEAAVRAVAAWAGVAASRVSLVRGAKNREKTFRID